MTALRALAAWALMMAVESLHGVARVAFLAPRLGDAEARRVAVLTGSVLVMAVALATVRWIGAGNRAALLRIGLAWVALTVAFEVALGRLVLGLSWERILSDYDLARGALMPLGLVVLALAPWLAALARGLPEARR